MTEAEMEGNQLHQELQQEPKIQLNQFEVDPQEQKVEEGEDQKQEPQLQQQQNQEEQPKRQEQNQIQIQQKHRQEEPQLKEEERPPEEQKHEEEEKEIYSNSPYFSKISRKFNALHKAPDKSNALPAISGSVKVRTTSNKIEDSYISYSAKLQNNRHLSYLFNHFCKQMMYKGGAGRTFDDIAESSEKMQLSKWMIFCKEFDLTKKLTPKQAIDIFKIATNYYSEMDYEAFVRGLQLVKRKGQIEQKQFINDMLHVNNHYDARDKLGALKVHFCGPQKNSFEECHYTEEYKKSVRPRQQYKRQIILHNGRSYDHVERELNERKVKREEKKFSRVNNYSQIKHKPYLTTNQSSTKKKEKFFESYRKIFKSKGSTKEQETNFSTIQRQKNFSQLTKGTVSKKIDNNSLTTMSAHQETKAKKGEKPWLTPKEPLKKINEKEKIVEVHEWNVDSEAESDEILREHYENEKQSKKMSMINKSMEQKLIENSGGQESDKETTMMITEYR